jgi:hypothetical protein
MLDGAYKFSTNHLETSMPIMTSVAMPSVILETLAGNERVIERAGGLPRAD